MKKIILIIMVLLCFKISNVNAQSTRSDDATPGFGHVYAGALDYLGWTAAGGGGPVDFKNAGVVNMSLLNSGDLNLTNGVNGYWIAGTPVLWHNNNNTNIYVGANAGFNSTPVMTSNTFVGNDAGWTCGFLGNLPFGNTFIGYRAGFMMDDPGGFPFGNGSNNTFIGRQAGENINSIPGNFNGRYNTFVGSLAGQSPLGSRSNCNSFFGYSSGNAIATGANNAFFGCNTGIVNNTGSQNSFFGDQAGFSNTSGSNTIFIGPSAGYGNITTGGNIYIGVVSGFLGSALACTTNVFVGNSTGGTNNAGNNNFFGHRSGFSNTTGFDNSFSGTESGFLNSSGIYNTFIGNHSGHQNQLGNNNTFVGREAGYASNTADSISRNTFIGASSGRSNGTGIENTFLGYRAGVANLVGNQNTYIGVLAGTAPTPNNLVNAASIGYHSHAMVRDNMILGNNDVRVGIGLSEEITGVVPGPNPLNSKLEINAISTSLSPSDDHTTLNGVTATSSGFSGLRFRDLRAGAVPSVPISPNPGPGVLAVDANGDVIYVPDNGGGGLGNQCLATPNPLTSDWEIPLIEIIGANTIPHDFYFSGQYPCKSNVAIGLNCGFNNPISKLHVLQASSCIQTGPPAVPGQSIAGEFDNQAGGGGFAMGLLGSVTRNVAAFNVGVQGYVPVANGPLTLSYAVYGDLGPAGAPCGAVAWPPGCSGGDAAGYFNGDVVTTTAYFVASDANLKNNIQNLANPMTIINQLQPKSYSYNQLANQSMKLLEQTHAGFLAQDVQNVLPNLVKDCVNPARFDSLGNQTLAAINYKAINYVELIPYLIAGLKQLDSTNQALQNQVSALRELVENCCDINSGQLHQNPNGNNGTGNSIDVILASRGIVLNQNEPNPYKENTIIEYFIPDDAQQVKIIFTDNKGSVLKEVEIPEKGKGQLNVYASDLSSGIYTYTIVANGITIDSKRMVKTK